MCSVSYIFHVHCQIPNPFAPQSGSGHGADWTDLGIVLVHLEAIKWLSFEQAFDYLLLCQTRQVWFMKTCSKLIPDHLQACNGRDNDSFTVFLRWKTKGALFLQCKLKGTLFLQ